MPSVLAMGRQQFELARIRGAYALISFRDPGLLPTKALNEPVRRLDVLMHDTSQECAGLTSPTRQHAAEIASFARGCALPIICQCEAGVGRSLACAAVLDRWQSGNEWRAWIRRGTHNRKLYQLLCAELNLDMPPDPLVTLAVRIKYPLERMAAFVHSLYRQRYENWQALFVTDGPLPEAPEELALRHGDKIRVLETPERLGLWGHPYRQFGIDACLATGAAWIGLNNDDNYLTPGYLEQLVGAAQEADADFAICQMLHSYFAWAVLDSLPKVGCADIGNWIASADLMRGVAWEGRDSTADGRFVERLTAAARRVVRVQRPLLVKN